VCGLEHFSVSVPHISHSPPLLVFEENLTPTPPSRLTRGSGDRRHQETFLVSDCVELANSSPPRERDRHTPHPPGGEAWPGYPRVASSTAMQAAVVVFPTPADGGEGGRVLLGWLSIRRYVKDEKSSLANQQVFGVEYNKKTTCVPTCKCRETRTSPLEAWRRMLPL